RRKYDIELAVRKRKVPTVILLHRKTPDHPCSRTRKVQAGYLASPRCQHTCQVTAPTADLQDLLARFHPFAHHIDFRMAQPLEVLLIVRRQTPHRSNGDHAFSAHHQTPLHTLVSLTKTRTRFTATLLCGSSVSTAPIASF